MRYRCTVGPSHSTISSRLSATAGGNRVPDVTLTAGRLYECLRGGRFVLITPRNGPPHPYDHDAGARKDRLAVGSWVSNRRTTVLVRPDGHVAWAAEDADDAAVEAALATALGRADTVLRRRKIMPPSPPPTSAAGRPTGRPVPR